MGEIITTRTQAEVAALRASVPEAYIGEQNAANILNGRMSSNEAFVKGGEALTEDEQLQIAMEGVARQLVEYSLELKKGDTLLIQMSPGGWQMASMVAKLARELGVEVIIRMADAKFVDPTTQGIFEELEVDENKHPEEAAAANLEASQLVDRIVAQQMLDVREIRGRIRGRLVPDRIRKLRSTKSIARETKKVLVIREGRNNNTTPAGDLYNKAISAVTHERLGLRWCLIYTPSQAEADQANMSLKDYSKLYYESCNQDWEAIEKAQNEMIELLQEGESIQVASGAPQGMDAARWSTDITFELDAKIPTTNSVARRNMPGSEFYCAPKRHTISGQYTLPYPVRFGNRVLPNLGLRFEAGKVVEHWIDNPNEGDLEYVQTVLDTDETREVGEWGNGTNPSLKFPFLSTLLIEKVSGSIHLALGASKENDTDNGVRSEYHIDLTRLLTPEYGGGKVAMLKKKRKEDGSEDKVILQEDGRYPDKRFEVFNEPASKKAT